MQPIHDYYEALAPTYDDDRFGNSYGRYVDGMERGVCAPGSAGAIRRPWSISPAGPDGCWTSP
jgi:hypothetical protein